MDTWFHHKVISLTKHSPAIARTNQCFFFVFLSYPSPNQRWRSLLAYQRHPHNYWWRNAIKMIKSEILYWCSQTLYDFLFLQNFIRCWVTSELMYRNSKYVSRIRIVLNICTSICTSARMPYRHCVQRQTNKRIYMHHFELFKKSNGSKWFL